VAENLSRYSVLRADTYSKFWEELLAFFLLLRKGQHSKKASNKSSIAARVFVAEVKFLPRRFLATYIYIYIRTDLWEGFMKYSAEMDSGAMIYIPILINTASSI
jgi:hypothetical protein